MQRCSDKKAQRFHLRALLRFGTSRHLNVGAGRIVWQDIVRIDQTIRTGKVLQQENIVKSFDRAKKGNGRLHFLGLVRRFYTSAAYRTF